MTGSLGAVILVLLMIVPPSGSQRAEFLNSTLDIQPFGFQNPGNNDADRKACGKIGSQCNSQHKQHYEKIFAVFQIHYGQCQLAACKQQQNP